MGRGRAARRLPGTTRRCRRAVFARRVDGAFTHATLPLDDVCKTVRRKDLGDIVRHSFAERLDLDAIGLSRR